MTKTPPVPPANRSPKGTGSDPEVTSERKPTKPENLTEQGQQGNITQNTTNQGYQQDR
jgi:hypothetical protein